MYKDEMILKLSQLRSTEQLTSVCEQKWDIETNWSEMGYLSNGIHS